MMPPQVASNFAHERNFHRPPPVNWQAANRESAAVVLVGGLLIYLLTAKAFAAYFFGENFIYLQQYHDNQSQFWRTFFSPITGIFYRPVVFAFELPWHFILPTEPLAFHLRNFSFILFELFLLHRILFRIVSSRSARILGCAFFAISKIPLTLIGYINTIDSLVLSTLMLLAVLFFLRFAQSRKHLDYLCGLLFCLLSDFSKDYGLVVNAVAVTVVLVYGINWRDWFRELRWWAWRLIPLGVSTGAYLWVRSAVLGGVTRSAMESDTGYAPHFSLIEAAGKILRFGTTLCNASWVDDGSNGSSGLSNWLATALHSSAISSITLGYCIVCGSALAALIWLGRKAGPTLVFPILWCGAYLSPTLLVQSVNIYYHWEPMIAIAVLLALVANAAGPRATCAIGLPLLTLIAISGFISNQVPRYHWSYITNKTAPLQQAVVEPNRGVPLASITFATKANQLLFWQYNLADPMLQQLTRNPTVKVKFASYDEIANNHLVADKDNLLLDAERGFTPLPPGMAGDPDLTNHVAGPAVLTTVGPNSTRAGEPFNMQPNAISAITVECTNALPQSVLSWNGTPLPTAFGNSNWLTALVPKELYARPGDYEISITTDGVVSNKIIFHVRP